MHVSICRDAHDAGMMRGKNRDSSDSIPSWPKTVAHSDGEGGSRWFKYLRAYSMAVSSVCWADLDDSAVWRRILRAVRGCAAPPNYDYAVTRT